MDSFLFYIQICVMLCVALVFGQLMRKLRQPAVVGELLGGIVLGPTVFGLLAPGAYHWLFPVEGIATISREAVIKIGMLFFLFVAGLEIDISQIKRRSACVSLTAGTGILMPFAGAVLLVFLWPDLWGVPAQKNKLTFTMFMGTALSISALPVIARILVDLELIREESGTIVMAAATISDLICWFLFAMIISALDPTGLSLKAAWTSVVLLVGFAAIVLLGGRLVDQRVFHLLQAHLPWPSAFIGLTVIVILIAAITTELIGIHAIFGAFLVGVALGRRFESVEKAQVTFYQFAVSFFAPLYFVSIGLRIDFASHFDPVLALLILFVACLGKIGGAGLGARWGGMEPKKALVVGFGLNARGAMEMILASVALEHRLIDERIFVALIFTAVVTSVLSGPAIKMLTVK
ncbi:MAG: cation:proton antiporter [Desulfobacterales bacterium]|nr:MAG: cation:proton antiporter [Desulfobacterales bacterium]